jgi:hypothetical protein
MLMSLIVQSERWCEVALRGSEAGSCTPCHEAAIIVCPACGTAVCDMHEKMCKRCGRSYCPQCRHACRAGPGFTRAA